MMRSYRGTIWQYDVVGYAFILSGMLVIILLGIATSGDENASWGWMFLYLLFYFLYVIVVYKICKYFQCKLLRQAHFVLSVVCRAENNRYYLKKGVEIRPGYLAKWVLFSVMETNKWFVGSVAHGQE